ncbi:hypothetical protein ACFFU1_13750 [Algibacter miyuki]|uniref:DUF4203 domain-containing protein n=1 Tax=Algibacter miyuki TaxID=1306933 RepID=A0ABV5H254_9FLAO|nr:hypothetical protein [Algibacter miyuki]MDN3666579.1 hypothetical protein [Algibacter miyuki]
MGIEQFILFLVGGVSAVLTFFLHVDLKQGPVRASSLVGVLVGVFVLVCPDLLSPYLTKNLPLVCFGASFIGMVSSKVLSNYLLIGFSGIVFTIIFFNTSSFFNGFGGGLGSAACIALLVSLSFPLIRKQRKLQKRGLQIKRHRKSKGNN